MAPRAPAPHGRGGPPDPAGEGERPLLPRSGPTRPALRPARRSAGRGALPVAAARALGRGCLAAVAGSVSGPPPPEPARRGACCRPPPRHSFRQGTVPLLAPSCASASRDPPLRLGCSAGSPPRGHSVTSLTMFQYAAWAGLAGAPGRPRGARGAGRWSAPLSWDPGGSESVKIQYGPNLLQVIVLTAIGADMPHSTAARSSCIRSST